jgi:hypothetical protein
MLCFFFMFLTDVQLITLDCSSFVRIRRKLVVWLIKGEFQSRVLIEHYILQNKTGMYSVRPKRSGDFTLEMLPEMNRQYGIEYFDIRFHDNPFSCSRSVCT